MSRDRTSVAILGVGAVACAACCAGPILGLLAAIGLGTAVGVAAFGGAAIAIGAIAIVVVLGRRRRQRAAATECSSSVSSPTPFAVEMPALRSRR